MRVSSTIKALRERCPSFENRVFGAMEWMTLSVNPKEYPAAYVFTVSENPKELQGSENWYKQDVTATVAVVLAVPSADLRGQDGADLVEDLKEEVFKAILSWAPTDDKQCIYEYSNYRVIDNSAAPSVWFVQLEFTCDYLLSSEDTRQPIELEETTGKFDTMYTDVDMIGDDGKPDGQIDAKLRMTGFYDGKPHSEEKSETVYKDLW